MQRKVPSRPESCFMPGTVARPCPCRNGYVKLTTMTLTENAPTAVHIGADELPFVDIGDGNKLKVIQVKVKEGLWIVENIFQKGYVVQKHKHTGPVYAYTTSGAWKCGEYDYVNRAGSLPYEPAGSADTRTAVEDGNGWWLQID